MGDRTLLDPSLPRTDLAIDSLPEDGRSEVSAPPRGVHVSTEVHEGIEITRVVVASKEGSDAMGKPPGSYITVSAPEMPPRSTEARDTMARVLAREIGGLLHLEADSEAFIVGLGNWNATPDALGPRVVSQVLVTRHLHGQVPADLVEGTRRVSALAPGVLGLTGIETGEIIRGIVEHIHPSVVIAVDSLASRSIRRLLRTIQIADTGIHPGSGVGNNRAGITQGTVGVPVIAIGVPTVVHAAVIASDTLGLLAREVPSFRRFEANDDHTRQQLIAKVLAPAVGDLVVTPKDIDFAIAELAKIIAAALNAALHPQMAADPALV